MKSFIERREVLRVRRRRLLQFLALLIAGGMLLGSIAIRQTVPSPSRLLKGHQFHVVDEHGNPHAMLQWDDLGLFESSAVVDCINESWDAAFSGYLEYPRIYE